MYTIYHKFTAVLILLVLTSCATIFKGSSADIRMNSQPSSANIFIDGINKGTTPATLNLDRDRDYVVSFRKDGYEEVKIELDKKYDAATSLLGNVFSWGVLGIIVDASTGAAYSLEPGEVQANMQNLAEAGIIEEVPEQKEGDITVLMLTKEQWEQVRSAE